MTEAYDLKELGQRLKAKGLIHAEEAARDLYKETVQWLKESAALSATPYDDLVVPFLKNLDDVVLKEIDKIDGQPS